MMDFIYELYKNDNFTLYLTIALVVLIILFFIVLLFGKRDQKLEETKRLQKIELDTFKEEVKAPAKVEVEKSKEEAVLETPPKVEAVETKSFFDDTLVLPKVEDFKEEEVEVTTFKPEEVVVEESVIENSPLLGIEENNEVISFDEIPEMKMEDEKIEQDLTELENIKNEFNNIEIPEVAVKEEVKPVYKPSQVFSSVFVDKQEPIIEVQKENEVAEEAKPVLEDTLKVEEKKIDKVSNGLFSIEDDDEEMELPTLKVEEPKTVVEEKSFSFDDLTGESYNIK